MSFNVTIFFCLLANFLFSNHVYEAAKISKPGLTIADEIKKDKNVCEITSQIQNSKYLQECDKLEFPDKNSEVRNTKNVTKENVNQFLCIALYDSFVKICQYSNDKDTSKKPGTNEISVWNNQKVFDNSIERIKKNGSDYLWDICKQIEKYSPVYNKTNAFVEQLTLMFIDPVKCVVFCERDDKTIEPLLIALSVINKEFHEKIIDNTEKKESITNKLPANDLNISNLNKSSVKETKIPSQKINSEQLKTVKNDSTIKDKSVDNSHPQSQEQNKNTNDKEKPPTIVATTTVMSKVLDKITKTNNNSSSKTLPITSNTSSITMPANGNDKTVIGDNTETEKKDETATSNTKAVTISEKTREDQTDQDYDQPNLDNADQIVGPEEAGILDDDAAKQQSKDIPQSDDDVIDQKETSIRLPSTHQEDDSHFLGYFTVIGLIGIGGCLVYHRKQKILAMIVEGRRSRGGRGRKRPSTASYRKLDCNLEEAVTSQCNSNVSHVIY
ncbi:hypothetical protein PV327_009926 [Microctonus hyperodae]|uniref:Uncharacterized protein n=1 Tax=Microctonus hyperodae TaxID=165561 RepID=A0AA39KGE7_MICHY|nr:hypothetical protein PV327_009926 [Microctonus hyperodae]